LALERQGFFFQHLQALQVVGQRVHLLRVVGQRAAVFSLGFAHLAHDVGVQGVQLFAGLGGFGLHRGACIALLGFEVVAIERGQAVPGAGQLRGKVGVDGECVGAARLVRGVLLLCRRPQGFVLRLCCLQIAPLRLGGAGLGLRGLPALLGLCGVGVGVQQRLQLLLFVLQLRLGGGGVQVFIAQCLERGPQCALLLRASLGVQSLDLFGLQRLMVKR
jgi:hypothetical protein